MAQVRSAPGAVRRGADAAVLRAPGRTRAEAPGVESAALTQNPPLGLDDFDRRRLRAGRLRDAARSRELHVDDGHRRRGLLRDAWGSRSCAAAASCASDTADAPRVAVVNEQFARHYWPGRRRRRQAHPARRPRRDARSRSSASRRPSSISDGPETAEDFVYLPLAQHPIARMVLLLRSSGDPLQLVDAGQGRRPDARPEHADAGDEDLRGPLPLRRRGRTARRHRAGRHHGRRGPRCWPSPACTDWSRTT